MPIFLVAAFLSFAQEASTLRSNTQLVQVNVIVRSKSGPVGDLAKGDFAISDRGKPRTISVFSINKENTAAVTTTALPDNTFSNRAAADGSPASVTMILLDRLNTLIGSSAREKQMPMFNGDLALANAKQHLLKFVDEMGPRDRVAIYSLGTALTVLCDFTSDRTRLKTVLDAYQATSLTTREVAEPRASNVCLPNDECRVDGAVNEDRQTLANISNAMRAETTMNALTAIAAHVAGFPGRKNLIWLTASLTLPAEAVGRALSRSGVAVYPVDARGLLPMAVRQTNDVTASEPMGSGTADIMGLSSEAPLQPVGMNVMQELADETGGRAFINTNDLTGAVRAAIDDGTVTYTLGFYVDYNSLDGKFHELKVRLKPKGFQVRAQRGYFASKDATDQNPAAALALPIASPLQSSGIHVLVKMERAGDGLSVSGAIDLRDLQLAQKGDVSKGAVEIYLVQQDVTGRTLESQRMDMHLELDRPHYEAYLKTGLLFRGMVHPKDGARTLRVITVDREHSNLGNVIVPLADVK